jgi:hypothetical protein
MTAGLRQVAGIGQASLQASTGAVAAAAPSKGLVIGTGLLAGTAAGPGRSLLSREAWVSGRSLVVLQPSAAAQSSRAR